MFFGWALLACHGDKGADSSGGITTDDSTAVDDSATAGDDSATDDSATDDSADDSGTTQSCDLEAAAAGTVTVDATCEVDPWDVAVKWQWTGLSTDPTIALVTTSPLVGHLDDDDMGGTVGPGDVPDVVFVAGGPGGGTAMEGALVALDGATGAEKFAVEGIYIIGTPALGDVDGDTIPDIVAFVRPADLSYSVGAVVAFDSTGTEIWRSDEYELKDPYVSVALADLEGDGDVEVIADELILDGATGDLIRNLDIGYNPFLRHAVIADLDLDGTAEIVLGDHVYDPQGNILWTMTVKGHGGHFAATVNYDLDPEGEVIAIGGGEFAVYDTDGTELVNEGFFEAEYPSPFCVGDFDGDGDPEVVLPAYFKATSISLVELDGTMAWNKFWYDGSGLAGCAVADLDGDGSDEVVAADEINFYILDGATGDAVYVTADHDSGTVLETPAIADVDGDGVLEVVLASASDIGEWSGITVLEQAQQLWSSGSSWWNQRDYTMTSIAADGTIPPPAPSWAVDNRFRGQDGTPPVGGELADLSLQALEVCVESCEPGGDVEVAVQVTNTGTLDVASAEVTLSTLDAKGSETVLASLVVPDVGSGEAAAGIVFVVSMNAVGADDLILRVSGGDVEQCDTTDDEILWLDNPCAK